MRKTIIISFIFLLFAACAHAQKPVRLLVSPEAFSEAMKKEPGIVLDVRTPSEFSKGHLKDAKLMNIFDDDFDARISRLDKSKTYYVYCGIGGRSEEATGLMIKKGFVKVYDLDGGIAKWKAEGKPVEK